jgi:hypothetical protein
VPNLMTLYISVLVPVTPWSVRCFFPRAQFIVSRDLHNSSVAFYNRMVVLNILNPANRLSIVILAR